MLAVLITLTPGRHNEFIDCHRAKGHIAVPPIVDVETRWYSILKVLEHIHRLREFSHKWLQNPKYSDYRPLFTTQDEWTIVKYIMEVLRPCQFWTLWMLKRHTVTLHQVITVYNEMFNHMDGMMTAFAKKKTPRKEDMFFTVKSAQQKVFKYCAAVTPTTGMRLISAYISSIISESCDRSVSGAREWILLLRTRHPILPNSRRGF